MTWDLHRILLFMENKKEVRVSSKTDPKQLAVSILFSLKEGKEIRAISIGEAVKTMAKAVAMIDVLAKNIKFNLSLKYEYIETKDGIKNAIVWTLSIK